MLFLCSVLVIRRIKLFAHGWANHMHLFFMFALRCDSPLLILAFDHILVILKFGDKLIFLERCDPPVVMWKNSNFLVLIQF